MVLNRVRNAMGSLRVLLHRRRTRSGAVPGEAP
jgi:hypothetical protein